MFCYSPSSLTVTAGDSVTWVNETTAPHTITRCNPSTCSRKGPGSGGQSGPSSPRINPGGGKFTFTFTGPGTYNYYSAIDGYSVMHGTITVVAATTTTTTGVAPLTAPSTSTTLAATGAASVTDDINANCNGEIFCYSPESLTVTAGDTVDWVNNTTVQHTVVRCDAADCAGNGPGSGSQSGLSSPPINPGGTYPFTFTSAGTYNYYCTFHGYAVMHGTITVVAQATTTTTTPVAGATTTTIPSSSTTVASTSSASTTTTATTAAGSSPNSSATGASASGTQLAHTGASVSPEIAVGVIVCLLGLGLAAASTARRRAGSKGP